MSIADSLRAEGSAGRRIQKQRLCRERLLIAKSTSVAGDPKFDDNELSQLYANPSAKTDPPPKMRPIEQGFRRSPFARLQP